MADIIVLVYYYPENVTAERKQKISATYIANLPSWLNNIRHFLPNFQCVLYCDPDFQTDPFVPPTVKESMATHQDLLQIRYLPRLKSAENNKIYTKLGVKYVALSDYRYANSVTFRDLDSPLTKPDALTLLTFLKADSRIYGSAWTYRWRQNENFGHTVGGGTTLKTPSQYLPRRPIVTAYKHFLAHYAKNNKYECWNNRSVDETFFYDLMKTSRFRFNDSIELQYNSEEGDYTFNQRLVIPCLSAVLENLKSRDLQSFSDQRGMRLKPGAKPFYLL